MARHKIEGEKALVTFAKGQKARLQRWAEQEGISFSELLRRLASDALAGREEKGWAQK